MTGAGWDADLEDAPKAKISKRGNRVMIETPDGRQLLFSMAQFMSIAAAVLSGPPYFI